MSPGIAFEDGAQCVRMLPGRKVGLTGCRSRAWSGSSLFTIGCEPTALAICAVAPVVTFALKVSWSASTARQAWWEVTRYWFSAGTQATGDSSSRRR